MFAFLVRSCEAFLSYCAACLTPETYTVIHGLLEIGALLDVECGPEYAALSVRSERRHAMSITPLRFLLIALLALTVVLSGCGSKKKGGGYSYGMTSPSASVLLAAPAA